MEGPPWWGWRSGIPHQRQGTVGNAAMEPPGRKGLFLLVSPNCLSSSGFHLLAQTRLDKPAVELLQWKDKCHQEQAHPKGLGKTLHLPGNLMVFPETQLPSQGFTSTAQAERDDPMSHSTAPRDGTGMGFPCRAQHSSWETPISSCWPKAGRGPRWTTVKWPNSGAVPEDPKAAAEAQSLASCHPQP